MVRVKWSRVLALGLLLIAPLAYGYLKRHISFGDFCGVPIVGACALDPELKGLLLLAIVLIGLVLIIKVFQSRA